MYFLFIIYYLLFIIYYYLLSLFIINTIYYLLFITYYLLFILSGTVRSGPAGPVRSGPVRSGPVRSGPVRSGPVRWHACARAPPRKHRNLVARFIANQHRLATDQAKANAISSAWTPDKTQEFRCVLWWMVEHAQQAAFFGWKPRLAELRVLLVRNTPEPISKYP